MFRGSITALLTPFKDNAVSENEFINLIEWQIANGTNGLVPCGTTGESSTLTTDEHLRLISLCVETTRKRIPVIAGTGSNSTQKTVIMTKEAKQIGADAALIIVPYYNKPSQEGIFQHFKTIHDAVDIPIVIYNNPARTVVDMSIETMAKLSKLPNIVGVKDATNDLARPLRTSLAIENEFCLLSGDDETSVAFLAQGGVGCISVTANIAPKLCADLQNAWFNKDFETVMDLNKRMSPLRQLLFSEPSPAPVKFAAELLGLCSSESRLPICELTESTKDSIRYIMKKTKLL